MGWLPKFEDLGEAMRPEVETQVIDFDHFYLSREERDYVAGHALDSIRLLAKALGYATQGIALDVPENHEVASDAARKITALSNLLGDIGWRRKADEDLWEEEAFYLWQLFPTAQLRPWLEGWVEEDTEALCEAERALGVTRAREAETGGREHRKGAQETAVELAQDKLGVGALLLGRLEKWMASHGN